MTFDVFEHPGCIHCLLTAPLDTLCTLFNLVPFAAERLTTLFTAKTPHVVEFHFNGRRNPLGIDVLYFKRADIRIPRTVEITNIDVNGFNGRDNFPEQSDIGTVVTVDKVEFCDEEDDEDSYVCFTCHRSDGSRLEMIGHEIESV